MARYIDADKLKQHYAWWGDEYGSDESKECKVTFDTIIDLQPTADVVEVVRCKECKWWRDTDHTCREWGGASPRLANAFCSEGERREDG